MNAGRNVLDSRTFLDKMQQLVASRAAGAILEDDFVKARKELVNQNRDARLLARTTRGKNFFCLTFFLFWARFVQE